MNQVRTTPSGTAPARAVLPAEVQTAFACSLLRHEMVTHGALQTAEQHASSTGVSVPEALIILGLVTERRVYRLLAESAGLFLVDPNDIVPSPLAVKLVPGCLARRHELLPLAVDDRKLTYLTTRPFHVEARKDVSSISGRMAFPVLSCTSRLHDALDRIYPFASDRARVPADGGQKPVVLIADDDATTRTLVRLLLERDGYVVVEADSGQSAVESAARHEPALIVMDLNMPQMTGYDAITALRHMPEGAATPIVVVTAEEGPAVEHQVLALGADDYIAKPFEPSLLTARIKAVFARQRMAA